MARSSFTTPRAGRAWIRGSSLTLLCACSGADPAGEAAALPTPPPPSAGQGELHGEAPFGARRERALDAKPVGLCAADFDGDGHVDLAATLLLPGATVAWRGTASGLAREGLAHAAGDFPLAPMALPPGSFGAVAKEQRLVIASRSEPSLELVVPFAEAPERRAAHHRLEHRPRALATGTIDGKAVIAAACDGRRLELLRSGEAALEHRTLGGDLPRCALVQAELGAVLVGFQDTLRIEAYAPGRDEPTGQLELPGFPRALAELDVDGDGDLELAVAGGDRELWIFGAGAPGGPRAWFEAKPPRTWTVDTIPLGLATGDFDGDGRVDLAVLHHYSLSVRLLTQLSDDGPGRSQSLYAGQTPCGLASLDFDGDGWLDVAVANADTQGLGFLPGNGAGALLAGASIPLDGFPNALAAVAGADRAAAGALRLVALNVKSNSISAVVFVEGAVRSLEAVPCGPVPRAPLLAQLDAKPGLELLLLTTGPSGTELARFTSDLAGRLAPLGSLVLGGAASDLLLLDADQDGGLELVVCEPSTGKVTLYGAGAARGEASALEGASVLHVPSTPRALAAIELDGDAAPEVACVLGAPGERVGVAWLDPSCDAQGRLVLIELGFTPLPGAPIDAVAGDLDGDGREDLALLTTLVHEGPAGAWFALLRGPGGPADFTVSAPLPTGQRPSRIAALDLDGDRRAEVFVTAQNSHLVNGWTSLARDAKGAFLARSFEDLGAGRGPLDLCISDVDGDGRLDLCVANGFSNDLSLLQGRAAANSSSNSRGN